MFPHSLPLLQHPEYREYQPQVGRTCPAPLTREPPRWLSRTPGVPTLAVTAAGQRETAEEPGGAEAPPPTRRRGSGSGSQQALPESERRCLAQTSGQPTPRKAAGRVRAARAEHRFFFFSLGHCCLGLLPAPRTLPSRGRPAWDGAWVCLGLGPGRWRWGETRGGRRGRLHLPRSPGPLRPFRAGPARSQPGRASATAPPASGARAPARRRSGSSRAGPGTESAAARGCNRPRRPLPPGLRRPPAAPR